MRHLSMRGDTAFCGGWGERRWMGIVRAGGNWDGVWLANLIGGGGIACDGEVVMLAGHPSLFGLASGF